MVLTKEFKIEELFNVNPTQAYKDLLDEYIVSPNGTTPFITTTASNNGVKAYSEYPAINDGNAITISDTTGTDSVFYQAKPYIGRSHVQGLYPKYKLNRYIATFVITAIKKSINGRYSYGAKFNRDTIKQTPISLPVQSLSDTEPDWAYMEQYMKEIEKKTILKVKKENDREIARLKELVGENAGEELGEVRFAEFRVGDLFTSHLGTKVDCHPTGKYKVISGKTTKNGINGYSDNPDNLPVYRDTITVANRGNSGTAYFQSGEFILSNNAIALEPKFILGEKIGSAPYLYIATAISKLNYGGDGGYSNYPTKNGILEDVLHLPVHPNNSSEPYWKYMERYIQKVQLKLRMQIKL